MELSVGSCDSSSLSSDLRKEISSRVIVQSGIQNIDLDEVADQWNSTYYVTNSEGLLVSFAMVSFERIAGTPTVAFGMADIQCTDSYNLLKDSIYKQAYVAFPDEDVIFVLLTNQYSSICLLDGCVNIYPFLTSNPNGEDRAWARRLANRFNSDDFNDENMHAKLEADRILVNCKNLFSDISEKNDLQIDDDRYYIAWGWAQFEYLEEFAKQRMNSGAI